MSGSHVDQHEFMLQLGHHLLPQSLLTYVAFRTALRNTWDQLDCAVTGLMPLDEGVGFLGEIPFLRETALHIQLDVLAETWRKHLSSKTWTADLLDRCTVFAACEYTARLAHQQPLRIAWALRHGPFDISVAHEPQLAERLRALHQAWSPQQELLLLNQCLDWPPEEAQQWKQFLGWSPTHLETLFEPLGRWHVSPQLLTNLHGLITEAEGQRLARRVGLGCPA